MSGLKHDGSFEAVREELKAQPHIIFSANPGDREFFLGNKPGFGRDIIETTYGSLKPCLHGSDAHKVADVLKPADDRFCWIRAELSFTGLKQTLIEPELRVAIGSLPPPGPSASEWIRELEVSGAPWPETGTISLNDGLVAIVGPKGSGKTALADMIARGDGATVHDGSSFLIKCATGLSRRVGSVGQQLGERGSGQHALGPGVDLLDGRHRDALLDIGVHRGAKAPP